MLGIIESTLSCQDLLQSTIEEIRGQLMQPLDDRLRSWFLRRVGGVVRREELLNRAERDGSLWRYGRTEQVHTSHPRAAPEELVAASGESVFSRPSVCTVDNVKILGPAAIGISNDGVVLDTTESDEDVLGHRIIDTFKQLGFLRTQRFLNIDCPDEAYDLAFLLVRHRSVNYYHWVFEYLRKLRALESYRKQTGGDPTVLIARDLPGWITESLKLAGYDTTDLTRWHGGVAMVDRLVLPEHRKRGAVPPSDCRWLRDRMTANVGDKTESRRIYVSRREADHRHVVNEQKLINTLSPLGFEIYILEQMQFKDQVSLFEDAELIVGPHGAGLVNMIFSADTTVVELLHGGDVRSHYFQLANLLSHGYDFLICDPEGENMSVDIPAIHQRVERALQSSSDS